MIYEKPMLNILEDLKKNKLEIVAGDASFRTFYRIRVKNKKYLMVDKFTTVLDSEIYKLLQL